MSKRQVQGRNDVHLREIGLLMLETIFCEFERDAEDLGVHEQDAFVRTTNHVPEHMSDTKDVQRALRELKEPDDIQRKIPLTQNALGVNSQFSA
jgi:hypothetical protein